jgi:hypothetical protein
MWLPLFLVERNMVDTLACYFNLFYNYLFPKYYKSLTGAALRYKVCHA